MSWNLQRTCTEGGKTFAVLVSNNFQGPPGGSPECRCNNPQATQPSVLQVSKRVRAAPSATAEGQLHRSSHIHKLLCHHRHSDDVSLQMRGCMAGLLWAAHNMRIGQWCVWQSGCWLTHQVVQKVICSVSTVLQQGVATGPCRGLSGSTRGGLMPRSHLLTLTCFALNICFSLLLWYCSTWPFVCCRPVLPSSPVWIWTSLGATSLAKATTSARYAAPQRT